MEASLEVPTATSVRTMPAKLLEENRRVINDYLARGRGGKVSFTHLIGWAIVRALQSVPALNSSFVEIDGTPHVVRHKAINLGLAVDVERKDGSRTLLVPNIKDAGSLDFAGFHARYEELIRKVRGGKITPDDFDGTTVSLTNPGMIGTVLSVPRLMAGQGAIIGAGAIDYPTEYKGTDPATLATLGVGKIVTLTSTYDHRIIQGAESGEFLDVVESLLSGEERFYDELFEALDIPYEPVRWVRDVGHASARSRIRSGRRRRARAPAADQHLSRARSPDRRPQPARPRAAPAHRARPCVLRPRDVGPRPRVLHGRVRAASTGRRCARSSTCCAPRTAEPSASSSCTSRRPTRSAGSRSVSRVSTARSPARRSSVCSTGSTPPKRSSASCTRSTSATSASRSRGPRA